MCQLVLCPPIPNVHFELLSSSLSYIVNAALNVPLAVATTFANLVVLLAMRHVTTIRLPSKLLLCSLVLTELGAVSVVQPQFVALLFSEAIYPDHEQCALLKSFLFTGSLFGLSSFFTLTSIALDRYAAFAAFLFRLAIHPDIVPNTCTCTNTVAAVIIDMTDEHWIILLKFVRLSF